MFVRDIIKDVQDATGTCNQETNFARLTKAIEVLANKASFDPAIGYADIRAFTDEDESYITLPAEVETPLAVNVGTQPRIFRNKWMEFHYNGNGGRKTDWNWDDGRFHPSVMDIINPSNLIGVADLKSDVTRLLRIFGYDENGRWIRSQMPDGTWIDGFYQPLNLITDFPGGIITASTTRSFERYFTIQKPTLFVATNGDEHSFTSGAVVRVNMIAAPMPSPIVNGGNYFVRRVDENQVELYSSRSNALTGVSPIEIASAAASSAVNISDIRGVAVETKFSSVSAHNMTTGMRVSFSAVALPEPLIADTDYFASVIDANNFAIHTTEEDALANLNPVDMRDAGNTVVALAKQDANPYTLFNFSVAHDFINGDVVKAVSSVGQLPEPLVAGVDYFVRVVSSTAVTLHISLADATNNVNPITMTSAGSGTLSLYKQMVASAIVGNASNISCTQHNLSVGAFVQLSTSGTLPAPTAQGTVYKVANPSSADTFTLTDTSDVAIDITTVGSGQLYLIVSRAFTIGFTDNWKTDTTNLTTADPIKLDSTGTLPSCTPAVNDSTTYYVRVISANVVGIYPTANDATNNTNQITVDALGSGVISIAIERAVTVEVFDSLLKIATSTYFTDGSVIRFETDGTLPSPLVINTDYLGYIEDGLLRVKTTLGANVTITDVGSGLHNAVITQNFNVDLSYTIKVPDNEYSNGDAVVATSTGTLPTPMISGSTYYTRYSDNDTIELYATEADAQNTLSTEGRIVVTDAGTGTHSLTQIKDAYKVSRIDRILKDVSNGIISLYAWDTGRTDNITVIGAFNAAETNPSYRRIRIKTVCPYVRIAYRRSITQIRSLDDFIPLNSSMAIQMACKAVKFYVDGFRDDGDKFLALAETFLLDEDRERSGPGTTQVEFNDDIWSNSEGTMT